MLKQYKTQIYLKKIMTNLEHRLNNAFLFQVQKHANHQWGFTLDLL
jgi:hypothetical protein